MSVWAGPTAFSPDPPKELVAKSSSFSKRELQNPKGDPLGMESFGVTTDGKYWRNMFIALVGLNGMDYTVSSKDDAAFFDGIVDSLCQLPPAKGSN